MLSDFPKLESPFIRKNLHFEGSDKTFYCVVPEIDPNCQWVFENDDVIASEKLDGTNIKIEVDENSRIAQIQNRQNIVDPMKKGLDPMTEAVLRSHKEKKTKQGKVQAGEAIGPKIQGNPYDCSVHIWIPFIDYSNKKLKYKSFHEHERTYENLSFWFRYYLFSLYYRKIHDGEKKMAEGVVFYDKNGQSDECRMAKLRRDMFPWYHDEIVNSEEEYMYDENETPYHIKEDLLV